MYLRIFPSRLQNINLFLLKFINLGGLSNLIEEEKESELFLFSPHTKDGFSVFDSELSTSNNIKINMKDIFLITDISISTHTDLYRDSILVYFDTVKFLPVEQ
jgi:hypothetical protein